MGAAIAIMPEHKRKEFEVSNEADFGYTMPGVGRFRVNVFRQRGMVGLAIRRVRSEVPDDRGAAAAAGDRASSPSRRAASCW